jgi:hypothetical protein
MGGQFQHADEIRYVTFVLDMLDKAQTLEQANVVTRQLPEFYQQRIAEEVPRSNFKDDKSWIQSLGDRIASYIVAAAKYAAATQSMAYKASKTTYLRELTAKKITLDERLAARIDKALKRLAQLKTFKQMLEDRASIVRTIDGRRISDQRQ